MLSAYRDHVADRAAQGIPPLPLTAAQASALCELLQNPPVGEEEFLLSLLRDRHPYIYLPPVTQTYSSTIRTEVF